MKQSNILFGVITFVLLSIAIINAIDISSGQDYSFESEQFDYFSVVGNSSNMEGMNITWENGNTTISFHPAFVSDSFTLIFWKNNETIIEVPGETIYVGGGGSSGGTKTVYKDRNITQYETVTEYKDKIVEKEVPGETITKQNNNWVWIILLLIIIITLVGFLLSKKDSNTDIRRYENEDKQKDSYANNAGSWN